MSDFPSILRDLREARDLKKRELADKIHVSPSMISQYESGRSMPSYDVLISLADFFEVSVDSLLGHIPKKLSAPAYSPVYHNSITQTQLLEMCNQLSPGYREALITTLEAFLCCSKVGHSK